MELSGLTVINFPSRWALRGKNARPALAELNSLAATIVRGCEAITGVYMRMTDLIRSTGLTDAQVREALEPHFPPARISEILRVSRAPESVYVRYTAGFFGFKAALRECRGYMVTPSDELRRRKIRRTAERLVLLLDGPAQITVRDHVVTVN